MAILERRTKPAKTSNAETPDAPPKKERERTPAYGAPEEKRERGKHDEKFNYGGRDQTPDEDVNPAEDLAEDEDAARAQELQEEPFASRLPGRAFRPGDLFAED